MYTWAGYCTLWYIADWMLWLQHRTTSWYKFEFEDDHIHYIWFEVAGCCYLLSLSLYEWYVRAEIAGVYVNVCVNVCVDVYVDICVNGSVVKLRIR